MATDGVKNVVERCLDNVEVKVEKSQEMQVAEELFNTSIKNCLE